MFQAKRLTIREQQTMLHKTHLRDAVRRKSSEKWRTNGWFLLHDNAPAHRPVFVKDLLATLQHHQVSKLLLHASHIALPTQIS